ncbi:MAG: thioredoxin domain-containing protein [Trichloromonadaceae bacterium]
MTKSTTDQSSSDLVERLSQIDTRQLPADGGPQFNRLIFEPSPYLLQHAENPVDWHPWGEAAFNLARQQDKPVFLSIGYSTCHWCHVMAHESFEDPEVAAVVNRDFVAIKVDREERPDIDNSYMSVCQMMTGSGGWPLTLVLTAEKKPFFAATYLPKAPRQGMIGLIQLLEKISDLWRSQREKLLQTVRQVDDALLRLDQSASAKGPLNELPLRQALASYTELFDPRHGGFGTAPKFPTPHNIALLLRLGRRFDSPKATAMALKTLQALRLGGIFDQLGGGIHRYSVDAQWLVPHFEKMLYDQALVALAACDGWQACGDGFYRQMTEELLDYLLRDLSDPAGGFYCGEDADSEGAEGTFYIWSEEEIHQLLGKELATIFCRSFGVTAAGNFEQRNIPFLQQDVSSLAGQVGVDAQELAELLASARQQLFAARQLRPRPHRDDKVLTAWNGLAIAALARAGALFEQPRYLQAARRAADFICSELRRPDGRLLRRWRRGKAAIPGFLDDYAFFCWGLLELYQASFNPKDLQLALELVEAAQELFADGQGGYYDSGRDGETVLMRSRSRQDGALPTAGAVLARCQLQLARLCDRPELTERAESLLKGQLAAVANHPPAFAQALIALDELLGPALEIVLVPGPGAPVPQEWLRQLRQRYLPGSLLLVASPDGSDNSSPLLAGTVALQGAPTAYLCRNHSCLAPVTSIEQLLRLIDA